MKKIFADIGIIFFLVLAFNIVIIPSHADSGTFYVGMMYILSISYAVYTAYQLIKYNYFNK